MIQPLVELYGGCIVVLKLSLLEGVGGDAGGRAPEVQDVGRRVIRRALLFCIGNH